jgi:Arc/MetJ family transcription regulator
VVKESVMTKILVDVDERVLARAAARLGTTTKKETIGKALELAGKDTAQDAARSQEWDAWADSVGERLDEVDWDRAWT